MSQDLSQLYQALDECRQRARGPLTATRTELAAWFRDFFRTKKGPAKSTHMNLTNVRDSETAEPQWDFGWHPGMHSRYPFFRPSQPVPTFTTAADVSAAGLHPGDEFSLRYLAFQDMAADAWEEAGGFSFPKKLMIAYHEYLSPGAPRPWVEPMRLLIRQKAEGVRPLGARWGLSAPQPFGLPEAPPELMDAVRNGVATAITDWADFLDQAGAAEAAKLLRWLPVFRANIAEEVQAVSPQFGFALTSNRSGTVWWWIGDMCSESDNEDARRLGRLMSAWNEMHPAIEWLLRSYGFPHVHLESIYFDTDAKALVRTYDFAGGEHLERLADKARVLRMDVPGWKAIEGE